MTSRYPAMVEPRTRERRPMNGTPGCPGPPVSSTSTPRGALASLPAATRRPSRPPTRPEWSIGTDSVEQVNPGAQEHGPEPVRRAAAAAGGLAWLVVAPAPGPVVPSPPAAPDPGDPPDVHAATSATSRTAASQRALPSHPVRMRIPT